MHVIERTDAFTLVGADARRGKLTLFAAEGPRERGALEHVALRVGYLERGARRRSRTASRSSGRARARRTSSSAKASCSGLSRPRRIVDYDLDHVALRSADPEATAREYGSLGFSAAPPGPSGCPRVEVGGAWVEFQPGAPGTPERPLLNHLAVLVDSADEHDRGRAATSASRSTTSSTRRTRSRSSSGARSACGSSTSSTSRRSPSLTCVLTVAGPGWPASWPPRGCASSGSSRACSRRGRAPGGSMLLSSCVVWRHLEWEHVPRGVPRRRRAAAAADLGAARRRARLARVARRGAGLARHREPAHDRPRLRPACAHAALLARDVELETPLPDDAERAACCSRPAASRTRSRASAACSCARTRGATATASTSRCARRRTRPPAWASSTAASCRRRRRASREEDFVPLAQLYGREARVFTDDWREITPPEVAWHENDLAQLVGPRAWYVRRRDERPHRGRARRRRDRGRARD